MSLGSIRQKRNMILILKGETVLDGILKLTLWILIIQVKDMNIVIIIILALGMLLVI